MKKIYSFFLFLFILSSHTLFSQDSLKQLISAYKAEINDSIKLMKVQKAVAFLEKNKTKSDADYIAVLEQLYLSQLDNHQDQEAAENAEKLIAYIKKTKNPQYTAILSKTAYAAYTTYDYLQNYTKALALCQEHYLAEKALYGEKSEEVAKVYLQFGTMYSRIDNIDEQIKSLDAARAIVENIVVKDKQFVFDLYNDYVITLVYYGDIPLAKTYLDKLNAFYEQNRYNSDFINHTQDEYSVIGINTISLALCNIMYHKLPVGEDKEIKKSIALFENALKKGSKNYSKTDLENINDVYCQIGVYYTRNIKDYDKAQDSYDKALKYNQNYPAGQILLFFLKGWTDIRFKKWESAEKNFAQSLKLKGVENFIDLITLYNYYGITLSELKKYEESEKYLQKVEAFYNSENNTYQGFMSLHNLSDLGELHISNYKATKDKVILERAYSCFKKASNLFSKVYQGDVFNSNLSQRVNSINEGLLYCATELGDKKGEVLELVEKNKSDFLWASFLNNNQGNTFITPKKLADSIHAAESKKEALAIKIAAIKDAAEIKKIKSEKVFLENNIQATKLSLEKDHPAFSSFASNDVGFQQIQKKLKKNEILIDYVVFDSTTYAFKVTKESIALQLISKENNKLKEACISYFDKLKKIDTDYTAEAKRLSDILLKPLKLPENGRLIILTNSFLSYLPFETLKHNGNFLVHDFSIAYASSVKLWNTQSQLPKTENQNLLVFSPEYKLSKNNAQDETIAMITREGDYELKGAKAEATTISELFNGTFFNSEKATKNAFIENASKYQILHLAMHSVMDEEDENLSNLIFSNNEKLYFPEIYNLKLPSDLAVLSACNTGMGSYKNGEGIMSISRAFTFAGVKSCVYSLWQVPDKETSEIMVSFYKNLKNGEEKDIALANAKTAFIKKNPLKSHPYYWAGFVVNGDTSAIATTNTWWLYILLGLTVLILLFVFRRKLFQTSK